MKMAQVMQPNVSKPSLFDHLSKEVREMRSQFEIEKRLEKELASKENAEAARAPGRLF